MYSALTEHPPTHAARQTHTHKHTHTHTLYQTHLFALTHTNTGRKEGSKLNPVDKEILQLCIKEDTEESNYSPCASCHSSNMLVHMLHSINQGSATCLPLHRTGVWWLVELIHPRRWASTAKQQSDGLSANNKNPTRAFCFYDNFHLNQPSAWEMFTDTELTGEKTIVV